MNVEYYFDTFMYAVETSTRLRLSIVDDEVLAYHLHFASQEECGKYQRMLHELHDNSDFSEEVQDPRFIRHLVCDNPFEYDYRLSKEDGF